MRKLAFIGAILVTGCSHTPWDYSAQNARISNCYYGATPSDISACLAREEIDDPVYPTAFKPGQGAFCSPDLNKAQCRSALETANKPLDPTLGSLAEH